MRIRPDTTGALSAPRRPALPSPKRLVGRVGYRTRTLVLGIGLALAAVVVTLSYVRQYERKVAVGAATARVFVAARDIPAGTTGAALIGHGIVAKAVPRRTVVSGAISAPAQVRRLVAVDKVYAGEQITTRRFRPVAAAGVRGELNGTTRAMVVVGAPNQILTGLVNAGDRVDVVVALRYGGTVQHSASRVILRDLLVLRAPAEATGGGGVGAGQASGAITLALSDRQAQKLFYAMKNGDWQLLLRPFGRAADSPDAVDSAGSLLRGGS